MQQLLPKTPQAWQDIHHTLQVWVWVSSESTTLHNVQERLKKRKKIYELQRNESEKRVNDYNLPLLLLWKANMDIQFVSESSLALVHDLSTLCDKS